jgi:hypothetical protein
MGPGPAVVAKMGSAWSLYKVATISSIPPKTFPAPSNCTLPTKVVVPRVLVGASIRKTYLPFSVATDAGFVIVTIALAVFVGSVKDAAVIVTLPPVGGVAGAVYNVVAPLAVGVTLNEPHEPAGVQLHTTEVAAGSLVVVATIDAVPPVCMVPGGGVVSVIVITGPVMVTDIVCVLVLSLTEVAVIVTIPPVGIAGGAVYTVAAPLAVVVGLNDPHEPLGAQLHVTPPFAGSFDTVAVMLAVAEIARFCSAVPPNEIEIGCWPPPEEPPPQPATTKVRTTVVRMSVFLMAIPPKFDHLPRCFGACQYLTQSGSDALALCHPEFPELKSPSG